MEYNNTTIVSDGLTYWNDASSTDPAVAVDSNDKVHLVWEDDTDGPWNAGDNTCEIMYAQYTVATGDISNATVISDKWDDGTPWNDDESLNKGALQRLVAQCDMYAKGERKKCRYRVVKSFPFNF